METSFSKIIFMDIGGVLLSNGWGHASRQEAARKFGYKYEDMEYLHNFIFDTYEIGSITLDQYLDTVLFYQERDFTKAEYIDFMLSQSVLLPQMLEWLIGWKSKNKDRFRVISINNEGRELNAYRIRTFHLHELFDAFVSSCEVGLRKPDPRIFKLAMGIGGISSADCIYIDDRFILTEAARKTGIQSYQHKDFETTKAILERLL